jgi:hypothetical protein
MLHFNGKTGGEWVLVRWFRSRRRLWSQAALLALALQLGLALLSGAQLATAPVIPAPIAPVVADVSTASAAVCLELCHNAFRSRAPPLS